MARENFVMLMGTVQGSPLISEEKARAKFSIQTMRRTGKIDYPIISVFDKNIIPTIKGLSDGDFVIVKGILATNAVKKSVICEHCERKNIAPGTSTEVIAIDVKNIGNNQVLQDWSEVSNHIMVLGAVCCDPGTRLLGEQKIPYCQYQVAINRSFIVKEQAAKADYPWVKSTGEQAKQDSIRLQKGSQVYIRGAVQTRSTWRNILCAYCQSTFKAEDFVAEIVPYSVEYLHGCIFEPRDGEQTQKTFAVS